MPSQQLVLDCLSGLARAAGAGTVCTGKAPVQSSVPDVDGGWHGGWLTTYKTYVHKNKTSVIPLPPTSARFEGEGSVEVASPLVAVSFRLSLCPSSVPASRIKCFSSPKHSAPQKPNTTPERVAKTQDADADATIINTNRTIPIPRRAGHKFKSDSQAAANANANANARHNAATFAQQLFQTGRLIGLLAHRIVPIRIVRRRPSIAPQHAPAPTRQATTKRDDGAESPVAIVGWQVKRGPDHWKKWRVAQHLVVTSGRDRQRLYLVQTWSTPAKARYRASVRKSNRSKNDSHRRGKSSGGSSDTERRRRRNRSRLREPARHSRAAFSATGIRTVFYVSARTASTTSIGTQKQAAGQGVFHDADKRLLGRLVARSLLGRTLFHLGRDKAHPHLPGHLGHLGHPRRRRKPIQPPSAALPLVIGPSNPSCDATQPNPNPRVHNTLAAHATLWRYPGPAADAQAGPALFSLIAQPGPAARPLESL
ncbi:hypothetical protein BKA56DRAFT_609844 [Ilyonectria sp. MPI-CAGE-AT-0026]|nr:hypothetical protein BKA56DRAFT_609844 [Ilyonectria sp. MPI-CAGE-AT-0026]